VDKAVTIIPVVLCGGSGTRLWPLSRESTPKQFLNLIGEQTLLQATVLRAMLTAQIPADHIVTVTLAGMKDQVEEQYNAINPAFSTHILCEPMARNTSVAVAFAANYVKEKFGPDALIWVLAADHHMADVAELKAALSAAVEAAKDDYLVTFGIHPSRAETGYGYVKVAEPLAHEAIHAVERFVEKPNRGDAEEFIRSGDYLWNSGMFLFKAGTVLDNYREHDPRTLELIEKTMAIPAYVRSIPSNVYIAMAANPFDKAIMEKAGRIAVVPCDPQWSDIGSWESLWEISDKDENENVIDGHVFLAQSSKCLIKTQKTLIGCAGIDNLVIVETDDAILIADKSNGDAIKELVTTLRKFGVRQAFESPKVVQERAAEDGVARITASSGAQR